MKIANKHKKVIMKTLDRSQHNLKTHVIDIKSQSVFVKQDFKPLDDRILDDKGRITISQTWIPFKNQKIRSFKIYRNGDGDLLLRPEVTIPAREAWIYKNPKVLASLQKGIKEIEAGKGEVVTDLDTFLGNL